MNRTDGFRKAIACHYAAASAPFSDVAGTVQEPMMNEALGVLARKVGTGEDQLAALGVPERVRLYHDVWRVKSRAIGATADEPSWDRGKAMQSIINFAASPGRQTPKMKTKGH
jgi:hypothetical protein